MQIWVDADACPKVVKAILFRAATRTKTTIIFVANKPLVLAVSPFIKQRVVSAGFDKADDAIVALMAAKDLVITADIPLANHVVEKGGVALNPRGELYSKNNIKQSLSVRNFHESLRGGGVNTGGPAAISAKEIQKFSNNLDKILGS